MELSHLAIVNLADRSPPILGEAKVLFRCHSQGGISPATTATTTTTTTTTSINTTNPLLSPVWP
jgi:hypothetical protein